MELDLTPEGLEIAEDVGAALLHVLALVNVTGNQVGHLATVGLEVGRAAAVLALRRGPGPGRTWS